MALSRKLFKKILSLHNFKIFDKVILLLNKRKKNISASNNAKQNAYNYNLSVIISIWYEQVVCEYHKHILGQ